MHKVLLVTILNICILEQVSQSPKKVALIIQNTDFTCKSQENTKKKPTKQKGATALKNNQALESACQWASLNNQSGNAEEVKRLLMQQGFDPENIVVVKNSTTRTFRQSMNRFIQDLVSPGAICVIYVSSNGTRIADGSGDELDAPKSNEDEVIVCTDTPNRPIIEKERTTVKVGKRSMDSSTNAIIDDEFGFWNDEIRRKIGLSGHYLFLADFCNAHGAVRGSQVEFVSELDATAQPMTSPTDQLGTFLFIAASTNEIYIPAGLNIEKIGYYVQALKYSFQQMEQQTSNRIYQAFFNSFKDFLKRRTKALINPRNGEVIGEPTLTEGHLTTDAKKLFFGGFVSQRKP